MYLTIFQQRLAAFLAVVVVSLGIGILRNTIDESTSPTRISMPESFVDVTIDNPHKFSASLYRVEQKRSTKVAELSPDTSHSLKLSSGIYQIKFGSQRQFDLAVPALSEVVSQLNVELVRFPADREGWCWIPDGPAVFGDRLGIGAEDERPLKVAQVPGFWLAEKEVTNRQYAEFLNDQDDLDSGWIDLGSRKCRIQKVNGSYQSDAPDFPVVMVSFEGAQAYCRWQSEQLGETCRLPTELEWEKAARGPESYVYSYGNVYTQSRANQESGTLKKVGLYSPNSFGLYDMTGNTFEWTANLYDPAEVDAIMNQSLRGGSFVLDGMYLRNSFRMRQSPSVMTDDIGFRVLIEPRKER